MLKMPEMIITPKTKVAEVIDAYPELEEVLIETVPAFDKLRNPVLRRTVARITTLQQAAAIGGADMEDLINHLREEVGQDGFAGGGATAYTTEQPDWFAEGRVVAELDAKGMLAEGEQPVNQVLANLKALEPGDIYKLTAPFLPAPVVDRASSLGIAHWVTQGDGQDVVLYFCRQETQ
jgi:hypothetical protein